MNTFFAQLFAPFKDFSWAKFNTDPAAFAKKSIDVNFHLVSFSYGEIALRLNFDICHNHHLQIAQSFYVCKTFKAFENQKCDIAQSKDYISLCIKKRVSRVYSTVLTMQMNTFLEDFAINYVYKCKNMVKFNK